MARRPVNVEGTEALQAVVDWLMDAKENRDATATSWLDDRSIDAILALYAPTGGKLWDGGGWGG